MSNRSHAKINLHSLVQARNVSTSGVLDYLKHTIAVVVL